jgi:hypothetical protein
LVWNVCRAVHRPVFATAIMAGMAGQETTTPVARRRGAYPGTFDPPTTAHLAIARAALEQCRLDRVDLVLSRAPLGKEGRTAAPLDDRVAVLEAVAASRPWLGVVVSEARLVADVAAGYDVVVVGADKWEQIVDPAWYGGSAEARDAALARLPLVAVAPRAGARVVLDGVHVPPGVVVLSIDDGVAGVSSTRARSGRVEMMLPEARAHDARTGVWASTRPRAGEPA